MTTSSTTFSFGEWVRRRRQLLDLTQATLAHRVGCAAITIRKIESDERRPSRQMAARLAASLAIAEEEGNRFIAVALGEQAVDRLHPLLPLRNEPAYDPIYDHSTLLPTQAPPTQAPQIQAPLQPARHRSQAQVAVPTDEIRVVTVVAVGISHSAETLWALRPDESAELIEQLHSVVGKFFEAHQIQSEHSLEGCLVAAFGAPHLHEDDPERALQTALQIQRAVQSLGLPLAIGIHSGPAYLNHAKETRTNAVLGTTVSLALRLQGKADDGQILVSKQVYRQTRRAFDFKPFISEPNGHAPTTESHAAEAHILLRPRQRMEKSRGIEGYLPTLIGREAELAKLEELVNNLRRDEGHFVILSGEAGVGKSRLIARLKADLLAQNATLPHILWLEGRCLEMTMSIGYGLFLDLLRSYFAWEPEDDEAARATRLLLALQELASTGHLSPAQVEKIGPLLGNLFSLHFGNAWDDQLRQTRPEQIRQQTFQAIYDLLVALAQRQPLLLIFEDLHWADGVSLDLIVQMMETLPLIPLLLLGVCRPEQAHRSNQLATFALHKCLGHFTEITLRELSPKQSRELLHVYLGDDLPDKVAQVILTRAQGNPFFIEEMVHTLISMDLLYQDRQAAGVQGGYRWLARANFDAALVPDSVQNLLLSRVDRLLPAQKTILHHAAVIGRHFSLRLLALTMPAQADFAQADYDDLLWQLEEKAFIYQERTIPEVIYAFRHILTHEAIYATIPRRRARNLHGDVAEALVGAYADELAEHYEQVAYHYERSEDRQKAVDYLLKAAQKARRAYLNEEAIGYFSRTLARLDQLPTDDLHNEQRLAALIDLGQTYYHGTSQLDQAESTFRQALALGKSMTLPRRRLARILIWLGDILMNWQPRFDESLRLGHEALALLGDDTACSEGGLANALISLSHLMVGNLEEANEYALRNVAFAHRLPCREDLDHLVYLAISCALGNLREPQGARGWVELSIRNAEQNQHIHALGEATTCLAYLFAAEGNARAGLITRQNALDLMLQAGDGKRCNWCQMGMLWAYLQVGDLQAFRALSSVTLTQAHLVNQEYLYDLYFCLGIFSLVEGAWHEAESHFRQAIQRSELHSPSWAESQVALGYTFLAQERRLDAIDLFKAVAAASLTLPDFAIRSTRGTREHHAPLVNALTGLDAALADDRSMRIFCDELQAEQSGRGISRFVQWLLTRSEIDSQFSKDRAVSVASEWEWQDALGDSLITYDLIQNESGIIIQAANARDLWQLNASAPRLTRCMEGDFALQVSCEALSRERPGLGGIVLWESLTNFVRLDWSSRGVGELTLMGCFNGQDAIVGRGRLRVEKASLRLERRGDLVRALCRGNGHEWYTVGQTEFSGHGTCEIGLYAIGNVDRLLYRGSYADGTAIRFSDLYLRQLHSQ